MNAYTQQQIDADWSAHIRDGRTSGQTLRWKVAHERVMAMVPAGLDDDGAVLLTEVCPNCAGKHCKECSPADDDEEDGVGLVTRTVTVGELRSADEESVGSLEAITEIGRAR